MKKYRLYDQYDACVVAESNETLELEIIKENIIKRCPKYDKPNRLVIQKN
ncbi:MAG: hypothetical protein II670_00865 [Alphaproteobacteria bacterium]|nr:hypothetical protein [Alphaproteobacteria bacterium]